MLVLTRKKHEKIRIGADIEVTVVDTGKGKVRIGITAPKDVPIHRKEIADRISAEDARGPAAEDAPAADGARHVEVVLPPVGE